MWYDIYEYEARHNKPPLWDLQGSKLQLGFHQSRRKQLYRL